MIKLDNEFLAVELYDIPAIKSYFLKPAGTTMHGAVEYGSMVINGVKVPWDEWSIEISIEPCNTAVYKLYRAKSGIGFDCCFSLDGNMLEVSIQNIVETKEKLRTLEWDNMPLITCTQREYSYWRERWVQRDWDETYGRGLYECGPESRKIVDAIPDNGMQSTIHACIFNEKMCCFVYSNYPHMPLLNRLIEGDGTPGRSGAFSISLNKYQYQIRNKVSANLSAKVVFLTDINGDGRPDECDYRLWLNRQFPEPKQFYKNCIVYKMKCAEPGRVYTTFKQALEIVKAVYNLTDGMPQIAYLVGWQYDGHDTGYPSLDKINEKLGSREELLDLIKLAKEQYNCIVSYHINLDDAYMDHPGWDPGIMCRDIDGSLLPWEVFNGKISYHICHTKDVESGKFFGRIKEMMKVAPFEQTIHIDAFRNTNCSWEQDGYIGVMEELECGVKPILEYFNSIGVDVTTESVDRFGIESAGLFSTIWHMYDPQLYHGKILGGGRGTNTLAFGMGTSLDFDLDYDMYKNNWGLVTDQIFLGSILYQLYLTREMTQFRRYDEEKRVCLTFGNDIETIIDYEKDHLKVKWGESVIAFDGNRFIPIGNAIYAYSKKGGNFTWRLPEGWENAGIRAIQLTAEGKRTEAQVSINKSEITITLEPGCPVKLTKI